MEINWECDPAYLMTLSMEEQQKLLIEGRVLPNNVRCTHNLRLLKRPATVVTSIVDLDLDLKW